MSPHTGGDLVRHFLNSESNPQTPLEHNSEHTGCLRNSSKQSHLTLQSAKVQEYQIVEGNTYKPIGKLSLKHELVGKQSKNTR
jgi:hypothetical protein